MCSGAKTLCDAFNNIQDKKLFLLPLLYIEEKCMINAMADKDVWNEMESMMEQYQSDIN